MLLMTVLRLSGYLWFWVFLVFQKETAIMVFACFFKADFAFILASSL